MGHSQSCEQPFLPTAETQNGFCDLQCCETRNSTKRSDFNGTSKNSASSGFGSPRKPFKHQGNGPQVLSPKRSSGFHSVNIKPLEGWTVQEQKVVTDQIQSNHLSRKHPRYLDMLFERIHKLLPEKSLKEIEACHSHVRSQQVAYFSVKDLTSKPPTGPIVQSNSPVAARTSNASPSVSKKEPSTV